jgi:hypothetical protein
MKNQSAAMAAVLAVVASTSALAESPQQRQACENDAFAICGEAIPDRDRVFACLRQNIDELSAGCHAIMAQYAGPHHAGAHRRSTVGAGGGMPLRITPQRD